MKQNFSKFVFLVLLGSLLSVSGQTQPQDPSSVTPEKRHEIHSKIFHVYWRETIPQLLANRSGDLYLEDSKSPGYTVMPLNTPAYPPYALGMFACSSDAVVLATAQTSISHLTADQKFVYTDWTFTIEQVLKDNAKSHVPGGMTILVTRPGGTVEINNRKIYATDHNFKDFKASSRYLLFLEFIPETGAYKADGEESFLLDGKQVVFLLPNNPHPEIKGKDTDTFISDTIAAISSESSNCVGRGKQ